MMPYGNPYAQNAYYPPAGAFQPQPRMQGSVLVLPKQVSMPHVCVKCGVQHGLAERPTKLAYVPGYAYAMVVLGWAIGLIVMAATRKTAQVSFPVCDGCNKRWSQGKLYFGLSFLPAAFLYLLMIVFAGVDLPDAGAACMMLGTLALVVAPLVVAFAITRPRSVIADRIDEHFVYLKGVHANAAMAACGHAPAPSYAPAPAPQAPYGAAPHAVPQAPYGAAPQAPYGAPMPAVNAPGAASQPPPGPAINAPGATSQPPAAPTYGQGAPVAGNYPQGYGNPYGGTGYN
jgi:hypothetical protein